MKRSMMLLLLIAFSHCALLSLSAEEVNGVVFSIKTDTKRWRVGNEAVLDGQKLIQYIPEGENPDNWTELFSIQTVEARLDPDNIFNLMMKELTHNIGPCDIVESRVLSRDCAGVFAEWWINVKSPLDQHEWIRVFNAGEYTIVLRYTTKKTDKLQETAKIWVPILQNAYFMGAPTTRLKG